MDNLDLLLRLVQDWYSGALVTGVLTMGMV